MMDETLGLLALRAPALALSIATTGSATLSATSTGFARTAGSFVTDGFRVGMEVKPAAFSSNAYGVVTSVSALALGIAGGRTVEAAGAGRSIVAGLPEGRQWENVAFSRTSGRVYIAEEFVPANAALWTAPRDHGRVEETGLYKLQWHGLTGYGPEGIRDAISALKQLYRPGLGLGTLADGTSLRVGANPGPYSGGLLRIEGGWTALVLTIPWVAQSINAPVSP